MWSQLVNWQKSTHKPSDKIKFIFTADFTLLWPNAITLQVTVDQNYVKYYQYLESSYVTPEFITSLKIPKPVVGPHPRQIVFDNSEIDNIGIVTNRWPQLTLNHNFYTLSRPQVVAILCRLLFGYERLLSKNVKFVHGNLSPINIGLIEYNIKEAQEIQYWPVILNLSGASVNDHTLTSLNIVRAESAVEDIFVLVNLLLMGVYGDIRYYHVYESLLPLLSVFYPNENKSQLSRVFVESLSKPYFSKLQKEQFKNVNTEFIRQTWSRQFDLEVNYNPPTDSFLPAWKRDSKIIDTDFGIAYLQQNKIDTQIK